MELINKPKIKFDSQEIAFIKTFAEEIDYFCRQTEKITSLTNDCSYCPFNEVCSIMSNYGASDVAENLIDCMINPMNHRVDIEIENEH